MQHPLVFYDGVCGLCNWSVRWLIKHDRKKLLRYAPIQSDLAEKSLKGQGLDITTGSIIFLEDGDISLRSDAVIRILTTLGGIYKLSIVFRIIPRFIRDAIYGFIARKRYKWFGKYDSCPVPSPETRELFLDREV